MLDDSMTDEEKARSNGDNVLQKNYENNMDGTCGNKDPKFTFGLVINKAIKLQISSSAFSAIWSKDREIVYSQLSRLSGDSSFLY